MPFFLKLLKILVSEKEFSFPKKNKILVIDYMTGEKILKYLIWTQITFKIFKVQKF